MKKSITKMILATVIVVSVATTAGMALTGCGEDIKLEGVYRSYQTHNHNTSKYPIEERQFSSDYMLEVYSDGTYVMNYDSFWAIAQVDTNCGRNVISYGNYTSKSNDDGTVTYSLEMPTRVVVFYNSSSNVSFHADSANWVPNPDAEDGAVSVALHSRADVEIYYNGDQFLKTFATSYDCVVDTTKNNSMTVTYKSGAKVDGHENVIVPEIEAGE